MENIDIQNLLERFKIPIALILSICAVICGVLFFQKNQKGEEDIRLLTGEEIEQIKGINQAGLEEKKLVVDIEGQVANPGVIEVDEGVSLLEVIELAGGFTEKADMYYIQKQMNLAKLVEDREKIYIPSIEEGQDTEGTSAAGSQTGLVNLNTATLEQLDGLSGIGPSTAQKIIDARPFGAIEEIMDVSGIGESTFEKIKNEITI
ncbi:helix-hairpin-helix domain-containing protein [Candidatus Dojkabacteria bacterium]|nr:helix-hairpin-helix domain-containing protein [Candidatus Dojkabacteria bacterium]